MRIGFGYDSHRLVAGRKLVLGGSEIPFEKGLSGHSDADVLVHAICDAILGAVGDEDIGRKFPDTDSRYRGISSIVLLEQVRRIAVSGGYRILNVDSTIILEKPKLAGYLSGMTDNISRALLVSPDRVGVKAKTNEGMGLVGSEEGAAAFAVALLEQG